MTFTNQLATDVEDATTLLAACWEKHVTMKSWTIIKYVLDYN